MRGETAGIVLYGAALRQGPTCRLRTYLRWCASSAVLNSFSQLTTSVSRGRIRSFRGDLHSVSTSAYTPPSRSTTMYLPVDRM